MAKCHKAAERDKKNAAALSQACRVFDEKDSELVLLLDPFGKVVDEFLQKRSGFF
jgi:hypothetical protein